MRRLPSLNGLRAFEAAARHLSFTRAAEELFVTPAAVSQQVKALEEHLGVALFRRLNRRLALAEAGRALLPGVSDGLDRMAAAVSRVRAEAEDGQLTVTVGPGFAAHWLLPRLEGFHERYPDLDVRISASPQLTDFAEDEVDIGIRYGPGDYEGLTAEKLLSEQIAPLCSPRLLQGARPLRTPADLRHHQLLHSTHTRLDETPIDWASWLKARGVEGVDHRHGMSFDSPVTAMQAAIQGHGVMLGQVTIACEDIEAGRLIIPFDDRIRTSFAYWLVYPPERLRWQKVRAFRDWIVEEARAEGDLKAVAAT